VSDPTRSIIGRLIGFCLHQKLVVLLAALLLVGWGVMVAPFDWDVAGLERDRVPVDAIPDLGENQQIVFTPWAGHSPQDIEDQVTFPLTTALQGVPGVKSIRSFSNFGFSTIYVIFEEDIDFYWSRSRLLEKLASLPAGTLPSDIKPTLGPDATGLGQVFWYTLEGRNPNGNPAGGWDPAELRSIQDFYLRYALASAEGVAEAASVGGFVREYQVDIDPDAMHAYGVTLDDVYRAINKANLDVSAGTIEDNGVEYMIRGLGFIKSTDELAAAVVKATDGAPITVGDVAVVTTGPAERRGVLDKNGAEAVGGVVTARYGENPLKTLNSIHDTLEEVAPGLPRKPVIDWHQVTSDEVRAFANDKGINAFADDGLTLNHDAWLAWLDLHEPEHWPDWITTSQVTVVPFYDRSTLIFETLDTLNNALIQQVLVTIIVVLVMVFHLRSSLLISLMLPMTVLFTFIAMKVFGVDANVVALAGIAIAIGTVVDMGIVLTENILSHLKEASPSERRIDVIHRASAEVGSAVLTAVMTTVVGFLPVFVMVGAEGKLFRPLAFTKTFALVASIIIALTILPPLAHLLLGYRPKFKLPERWMRVGQIGTSLLAAVFVAVLLARDWEPLGPQQGIARNLLFVFIAIGGLLVLFRLFILVYGPVLAWCLWHKPVFLSMPALLLVMGAFIWLGADRLLGWTPSTMQETNSYAALDNQFPGLGKEFMPALDEGSFLYMPTLMPHASIGEATEALRKLDAAISAVPEVDLVVGKIGRADTPLDPAPISMVETVIHYVPEYELDDAGRRKTYRYDRDSQSFERDAQGNLIPDPDGTSGGRPFRQWRDHIQTPDDIWTEIQNAAKLTGVTSAPKLQPIETRQVMLQTGMRAPFGVKVFGPDLDTIERIGFQIERILRQTEGVNSATVNADRIVGTPYLEIVPDRQQIARYNLNIADVQRVIQVAIGGRTVTTSVEGRERYAIRVRYLRELRDRLDRFEEVLVPTSSGAQIPLTQLAEIQYVQGPRMIKSEDTSLVGYVTFGPTEGYAEADVAQRVTEAIAGVTEPGVRLKLAGNFENQARAQKTLMIVLPVSLAVIFIILQLQFKHFSTSFLIFTGIAVAWAGGFLLIWLYGQPWFLNFELFGTNLREVFQVRPIALSIAVWVGFLALFGIATDDGVVMATYLGQRFEKDKPTTIEDIRNATIQAGLRRVRPCLMTTATTILALLPVLTATGRGADIMLPMALPSIGGMLIAVMTMFLVPVLYCLREEAKLRLTKTIIDTPQTESDGKVS
jgi:Cu(I)/Ag(I) efflux system membrane protein CusA/SilA